jgi:hypothetical protein
MQSCSLCANGYAYVRYAGTAVMSGVRYVYVYAYAYNDVHAGEYVNGKGVQHRVTVSGNKLRISKDTGAGAGAGGA